MAVNVVCNGFDRMNVPDSVLACTGYAVTLEWRFPQRLIVPI